jgi:hypothetical protein
MGQADLVEEPELDEAPTQLNSLTCAIGCTQPRTEKPLGIKILALLTWVKCKGLHLRSEIGTR